METTKLGQILNPLNNSSAKCTKCGLNPRRKNSFGELASRCIRCIRIGERKARLTAEFAEYRILKMVGSLYLDAKLDDLDQRVQDKLKALKYGQDVFMFGPVGTGKTYAMAALLRHYVYEGYECYRINFDEFCVKVRATMSLAVKETEWELTEPLKTIDKLFIDDLGLRSKQETDFAYVTLYSLLNKRQERRLPTFISSNKSIDKLGQQFDARIASRLQTAQVIEITGNDRRGAK